MSRFVLCVLCLLLAGCAGVRGPVPTASDAKRADYTPISYAQLPGWQDENFAHAMEALRNSCTLFLKRAPSTPVNPSAVAGTIADWQPACNALNDPLQSASPRLYFETYFTPYKIDTEYGDTGLFTGYYEKKLKGSRLRTAQYTVPIYRRPPELVTAELGDFRPALKGERIAGEVREKALKPYFDRRAIDKGALANRNLELAWADDANAVFFLHVQGSGRVQLDDGSEMRIGYDGQNGYPYHAIGRELIARNALTKEDVSLESIRQWLETHPDQADDLRWTNPSYVFFKEMPDENGIPIGPTGAQGVALTPQRSLAVDPRFIPYGAPVFVDITSPPGSGARVRRMMIAQDTGGAIRGPVRGDFFWGAGSWEDHAAKMAGGMKSHGQAYLLLPKTLSGARRIDLSGLEDK